MSDDFPNIQYLVRMQKNIGSSQQSEPDFQLYVGNHSDNIL